MPIVRRLTAAYCLMSMLALALALAGCAHASNERARTSAAAAAPMGWRTIATEADRARLRDWRQSWLAALASASAAGAGQRIAAQGVLLQPDAALAHVAPPPGDYRCRIAKLGARTPHDQPFAMSAPFRCRIALEREVLSLAKLDGAQRPAGLLFRADDSRMIFLGTMMLGDETMAMQYGRDAERDMAGAFERIGPQRWRLVLPAPRWESLLAVVELVPA